MMKTSDLVVYLNNLLLNNEIQDDSLNGLQVANQGNVNKVALAVDGSLQSIQEASQASADFLFVHHGLFWANAVPIVGGLYHRIKSLIESDIALYASHLPLDRHPELGNNAQIKNVLGWPVIDDFGEYHGSLIGKEILFKEPIARSEIVQQLQEGLNCKVQLWAFGPEKIRKAGYVSGGAIRMLAQAIEAGMDAYITGEPRHESYWLAKEAGINVIFGGHYATETLGVRAVGEAIRSKFGLETFFIDLPTGL